MAIIVILIFMTTNKFHDCQLPKAEAQLGIIPVERGGQRQYPNFIVHYQICYAYFSSGDGELSCCYSCTTLTEPVPILSSELRVTSYGLPVPRPDKWSWLICKPLLHWVLFMSFSCILWHFQHMLCHNKKPHLTLSYPLYLFSLFHSPLPALPAHN